MGDCVTPFVFGGTMFRDNNFILQYEHVIADLRVSILFEYDDRNVPEYMIHVRIFRFGGVRLLTIKASTYVQQQIQTVLHTAEYTHDVTLNCFTHPIVFGRLIRSVGRLAERFVAYGRYRLAMAEIEKRD